MSHFSAYAIGAVLFLATTTSVASAKARVYAKVESETTIYAGDQFVYSIVVEGGGEPSRIDLTPLAKFEPRQVQSGQSMTSINGRMSVSYTRNYAITAGPAGTMKLPGVTVVVDGETYTTNPVEVTISQPGTTDRLALEFTVSEKQCYVGQPVVMTVKWTVTARVQDPSFDVPVFKSDSFFLEDVSEDAAAQPQERASFHGVPVTVTESRELVRGMEAAILSFRKVLIPKRAGVMKLDPVSVSVNMATGRVRTNDIFGTYRMKFERVQVQSESVELNVLPLPDADKPAQFYGLVGRYTIAASATPTKVNVGDPITLTVRVGGNPYLKPVQWPELEKVPELAGNFKIPSEKASPIIENGAKVFTQTLRANNDAVTEIPALPLAYFDPQKGEYVVARTDPIKLEVAPTKVLTTADVQGTHGGPVNREVEAIRKGLSANYYGPEILANQSFSLRSAVLHPGYAALWSLPLLGLAVSIVVKFAGRTSPESLARKRRRQAPTTAMRQLKAILSADARDRHELLLAALKGYIGDRFDKVAASLTADDCHRIVLDATGDSGTADSCRDLIARCEAARYARVEGVPPSNRGQDARDTSGANQVQEAIGLVQSIEKQSADKRKAERQKSKSQQGRKAAVTSAILLSAIGAFSTRPAVAQVPAVPAVRPSREQLFSQLNEANAAFQQANAAANPDTAKPLYDKAILLYEKVIDQGGVHNAKLYYNLANAYLLKDDVGRAILNYRRAARLDGSDLNIQKNLTFARSRRIDKVEVGTQRRVLETLFFWHYDFSLRTKFLLVCLSFAGLCLALTGAVWLGRGPVTTAGAVLAGVLLLCFLTSLGIETHRQANTRSGVITVSQVVARQGDGPNYPPSFKDPLHAGTEFELLEHRPGWLHIRLSDGTDAWIPDDTAGLV
jgi:tetratricopeptide (TPR) repeat protein